MGEITMTSTNKGMRRAQQEITYMLKELAASRHEITEEIPPDTVIESFGAPSVDVQTGWKIDGLRKDKRHGFVGEPEPTSDYSKSLLKSMFGGWN